MSEDQHTRLHGASWLRTGAFVVIVVAGLQAAAGLLIPVVVGVLLALVFARPAQWLHARGMPKWLAGVIVVLVAGTAWVAFSVGLGTSIAAFTAELPRYEERLAQVQKQAFAAFGLDASDRVELYRALDPKAVMQLVVRTAGDVMNVLSSLVIILLVAVFLLLEWDGLSAKLRVAMGGGRVDLQPFEEATARIFNYLFLKAVVSALTGALVTGLCVATSLDFPILWGLLAFLFNFIPNIGSVIASVPAVLLAVVQGGWSMAALVAVGYTLINLGIGNVLEPSLMGRRLGLSALVVFLSLLFWSWLWGPIGMLLSVPLTMVVKIVLEQTREYRAVAVLLGPAPSPEKTTEVEEAAP